MNIMEVFDKNLYMSRNIDSTQTMSSCSNNDANNSRFVFDDDSDGSEEEHNQFWRTKLCLMFSKGICRNGDKCKFAHGNEELRTPVNLKKTKLCPFWLNSTCNSGGNCPFAHGISELRVTNDYYKTSVCRYWKMGVKCDAGVLCRHAHGETELRRRSNRHQMKKRIDGACYASISSAAATAAATMAAVINEDSNLSNNCSKKVVNNDSPLFRDNSTIGNRLLNIPQIQNGGIYSLNAPTVPYSICDMSNVSTSSTASSSNSSINTIYNHCSTLPCAITNKIKRNYSHDDIFKSTYGQEDKMGPGGVGTMERSKAGGFKIVGSCFENNSGDSYNNYNVFQIRNSFSEQNLADLNSNFCSGKLESRYCQNTKPEPTVNSRSSIGDWKINVENNGVSSKDEYDKTRFFDVSLHENNKKGGIGGSSNLRRVGNSSNSLSSNLSDSSLNEDYFGTIWDSNVNCIQNLNIQQNPYRKFSCNDNRTQGKTLNLNQQLIQKLQRLQLQHKQRTEDDGNNEKGNEGILYEEEKEYESSDCKITQMEHSSNRKYSEVNKNLLNNVLVSSSLNETLLDTGAINSDNEKETEINKNQRKFLLGDFLENCPSEFRSTQLSTGKFVFNSPMLVKLSVLDPKELSSIPNGEIPALIIPSDDKFEAAKIYFVYQEFSKLSKQV
ncbi:hypothetical protein FG386_001311 [Cryptosporidium ryanae]|uniref:uncharacterized protein n=1 Tax=Cryptosporidium ryanae TaxID=515981 RepID=UPI00351A7178|nr:hypothetical protein FG386_001311 [Cryptosporidium ryanae]